MCLDAQAEEQCGYSAMVKAALQLSSVGIEEEITCESERFDGGNSNAISRVQERWIVQCLGPAEAKSRQPEIAVVAPSSTSMLSYSLLRTDTCLSCLCKTVLVHSAVLILGYGR